MRRCRSARQRHVLRSVREPYTETPGAGDMGADEVGADYSGRQHRPCRIAGSGRGFALSHLRCCCSGPYQAARV
jgi:hypothetical protein